MTVTQFQEMEEAEPLWDRILAQSSAPTIFQERWWQKTWWDHFGGESDLVLLLVGDSLGTVGIAPLAFRGEVLEFLGGSDLFDYRDFIVARGREETFCSMLLDHLNQMSWRELRLDSIREDSPTMDIFPRAAEAAGMSVETEVEDVAPVAVLPPTWDEYLAGLSKKDRHELRRKIRRLDRAGQVGWRVCESPDEVRGMMSDFLRLHRASSPDKAVFMTDEREAFFMDAAEAAAQLGHLSLGVAALDGQPVASCLGFDYGGAYLLYNSGYDPAYSRLSVGIVSKALAIQGAIEAGKGVFDFLRGSEDYKYRLGGQDRRIYRLVIRR